jgi:uroporphyrinogen-III synthase
MAIDGGDRVSALLAGRLVVVTRPRHQQEQLTTALVAAGAQVVSMPLIEIVESRDGIAALRRLLGEADTIAWVVVSSPNGARVVAMLHEEGCSLPPVAVIGEATAEAIGHAVDLVSHRANAASLVEVFPVGSGRVVVVQGERADETLITGLTAKGWDVSRCDVYRTLDASPSAEELDTATACDAVVLASGSAVANWVRLIGVGFEGEVVVIGPVTRAAAEAAGLVVAATAEEPSASGIVEALCSALSP